MGKKSRRNKAKKSEGGPSTIRAPNSQHGVPFFSSSVAPTTSASDFENPLKDEPTPKLGWARELRSAEKELRHNNRNADVVIRTARAACVMRQFDRLDEILCKAESRGVEINNRGNIGVLVWKDELLLLKHQSTRVNEPQAQQMLTNSMTKDVSLDSSTFDHPDICNFNAPNMPRTREISNCLNGWLVFRGSLDYSGDNLKSTNPCKMKKPPGSTALVLALIGAMCARQCLAMESEEKWRGVYESRVECAIQLVRLGANVDVRLQLPTGRNSKTELYEMIKMMKWNGKTVRELAPETGSELFVQTIEIFGSKEEQLKLVNCRCGSRLPWKECHSAKDSDAYYTEKKDGTVIWRLSPLSPCPCKNTHKPYFKCCWEEPLREYFQDDSTAELEANVTMSVNDDNREYVVGMYRHGSEGTSLADMMSDYESDDMLRMKCEYSKKGGPAMMTEVAQSFHPKSKIGTWDPDVYRGVMELIDDDNFFQWTDIHWNIPKSELLKRVDEWNTALEKYCGIKGLTGSNREEVVQKHTASPFAPCGNLDCEKMESKAKEFSVCSRCLSVAYCSRACSKEDYQFHKSRCVKRRGDH